MSENRSMRIFSEWKLSLKRSEELSTMATLGSRSLPAWANWHRDEGRHVKFRWLAPLNFPVLVTWMLSRAFGACLPVLESCHVLSSQSDAAAALWVFTFAITSRLPPIARMCLWNIWLYSPQSACYLPYHSASSKPSPLQWREASWQNGVLNLSRASVSFYLLEGLRGQPIDRVIGRSEPIWVTPHQICDNTTICDNFNDQPRILVNWPLSRQLLLENWRFTKI